MHHANVLARDSAEPDVGVVTQVDVYGRPRLDFHKQGTAVVEIETITVITTIIVIQRSIRDTQTYAGTRWQQGHSHKRVQEDRRHMRAG